MEHPRTLTTTIAPESVAAAVAWRRHLHSIPELQYDLEETCAFVVSLLVRMGVDALYRDFAPSSVVAVIHGKRGPGKTLALRADMDALPIFEVNDLPWVSQHKGRMHACGHDGHIAMLLLAATELCRSRDFNGTCVLLFQPAEEGGAGARRMIEGGLFNTERFAIDEVYGLHNMPGYPIGWAGTRLGGLMAASDRFDITLRTGGTHAAQPHMSHDPIVVGAALVQQIQSIVSRRVDPVQPAVVSVTTFDAQSAYNVIPAAATLRGSGRSMSEDSRRVIETSLQDLCDTHARDGLEIELDYRRIYDPVINMPQGIARLAALFAAALPEGDWSLDTPPLMGAEDFSFYLKGRPGAFFFLGNGDSAPLHSDRYEFNDQALALGARLWVNLMELA